MVAIGPAAVLAIVVTANTKGATAGLAKTEAQLHRTHAAANTATGGIAGAARRMGPAFAAASVAVGAAAVHLSVEFSQAMTRVQTQAGASASEVKSLRGKILELAASSEFSPKELADGLFRVESAGFRGAKALEILKQSEELAGVGGSSLEDTTRAVTAAMRSNIKGAEDASKVVGQMNAVVGQGSMRMQDLTDALSTGILPAAKQFGLSFRDVGSAIALMTRQGVPARMAATRLRMTFALMAAPTTKAQKALKSIGLSSTDMAKEMHKPNGLVRALVLLRDHLKGLSPVAKAQLLTKMFGGGKQSATIMALVNNVGDLGKIYNSVGKKAGTFGEAVKKQSQEPAFIFKRAWSTVQVALIKLGDMLLPVLARIAAGFTHLVQWFMKGGLVATLLKNAIIGLAIGFVALKAAAAIGWIFTMVSGFVALIGLSGGIMVFISGIGIAMKAAFLTNPVGVVIMAIIALGVVFVTLYKKVSWFRNAVDTAWKGIKIGADWLWNALKDAFGGIKTAFAAVVNFIKPAVPTIITIFKAWLSYVKFLGGIFAGVFKVIVGIIKVAWAVIRRLAIIFVGALKVIWAILLPFRIAIALAFAVVKTVVKAAILVAVQMFKWFVAGLRLIWARLAPLRAVVSAVFHAIGSVVSWAVNTIVKPAFNAFIRGIHVLASAASWLWHNGIQPAFHGIAAAAHWVWGAVKAAFDGISRAALWVGGKLLGLVSTFLGGLRTMVANMAKIPVIGKAFKGLADSIGHAKGKIDNLRNSLKLADPAYVRSANAIKNMTVRGRSDLNKLAANARTNMAAISKTVGTHSAAGRRAMTRNFGVARDKVIQAMRAGKISTKEGMSRIAGLMSTYGIKGKRSTDREFGRVKQLMRGHIGGGAGAVGKGMRYIDRVLGKGLHKYGAKPMKGGAVGGAIKSVTDIVGGQRGGFINQGKPSGDTVPAVLERGEYVLNRKAVAQAGIQNLNQLNYGMAPRFQKGGMVGPGGAHMATGGVTPALSRLMGQLSKKGFRPSSTTTGQHAPNSLHYSGRAADYGDATNDMRRLWGVLYPHRAIYPELFGPQSLRKPTLMNFGRGFSDAALQQQHNDHIHVGVGGKAGKLGAGGAGGGASVPRIKIPRYLLAGGEDFGRMGQAALDKSHDAAQKALDKARPTGGGSDPGGPSHPGHGRASRSQMVGWARAALLATHHPATADNINKILTLAMKESGWQVDNINNWDSNAKAGNPSVGLMQVTLDKVGGSKARGFDPVQNMIASINYQFSRYGGLTTRSPYALGGLVGMQGGGDPWGITAPTGPHGNFPWPPKAPPTGPTRAPGAPKPGGAPTTPPEQTIGPGIDHMLKLFGATKGKNLKSRRIKAVSDLVAKIGRVGLEASTESSLTSLTNQAAIFGEYADRAQTLTGDGALAMINGHPEAYWAQKQLDTLFALRNRLVVSVLAIQRKQNEMNQLTVMAQSRKQGLDTRIASGVARVKHYQDILKGKGKAGKAYKHLKGKKKAAAKKHYEGMIKSITETNKRRTAASGALGESILPAIETQKGTLGERLSGLSDSLTTVQGIGSPMTPMKRLPALGILGGDIFGVQNRIKDLTGKAGASEDASAKADLMQTLATESAQRLAVSQRQYGALSGAPYGGAFATGGVVPGPSGAPRQALVHGREGVFTPEQMDAMGGAGDVQVIINGSIMGTPAGKEPVEVLVDGVLRSPKFKRAMADARVGGRSVRG